MQRPQLTESQLEIVRRIDAEFARHPKRIPGTTTRPKSSTGYGRSVGFGFIRKRTYVPAPSIWNKRWKAMWDLIKELGNTIDMAYDGVQVNVNCVCGPHRDVTNFGNSYLISGGDYVGGELVVENEELDCKYKPLVFDGSKLTHWNKPIISGFKWTLVFFSCVLPARYKHMFPENFRILYPNYRDVLEINNTVNM